MHETFMRRCFELARRGLGRVSPNPLVGAVLVKDGVVIGEGHHTEHGAPHAEPACFATALSDATGATLYVNLEPCCHTKKLTPPCVPLVISKKVARVVISNLDPNPQVAGQGVEQLRAAGIEVITGVLEAEGAELNEIFFHRMRTGLPFVHLKAAATLDGKVALPDGTSQWITGPEARLDAHWGRLSCDAIVVGAGTVRRDDPSLTVRIPGVSVKRPPWRIVLTASGELPHQAKLFQDEGKARTLIVTGMTTKITVLPEAQIIRLNSVTPLNLPEFFAAMTAAGIHSLWLEGGPRLHSLFLAAHAVDRVTLYTAPTIMGDGLPLFTHTNAKLAELPRLARINSAVLGQDTKITGRLMIHSAQ